MAFASDAATLVVLVLLALLPAAILIVRLRNVEVHEREPWREVGRAALWGATGGALLAIAAELLALRLLGPSSYGLPLQILPVGLPLLTVVVAPLVEEVAKALGLFLVRDPAPEPEDGFVYGGAAGLGFAATENLFYVGAAFALGGADAAGATALYRGIVTVPLHAATTALVGYGVWAFRYGRRPLAILGTLAGAVGLHAVYNAISGTGEALAILAAGGLAVVAFLAMVARVRALDDGTLRR